jgi:hypothetical protein
VGSCYAAGAFSWGSVLGLLLGNDIFHIYLLLCSGGVFFWVRSGLKTYVTDYICYSPVNTTLFPAGGVSYLGRHVSAHVYHLQLRFLVTIYIYIDYSNHVLNVNFACKSSGSTYVLYTICTILYTIMYSSPNIVRLTK